MPEGSGKMIRKRLSVSKWDLNWVKSKQENCAHARKYAVGFNLTL
jgi:hypothetical protein